MKRGDESSVVNIIETNISDIKYLLKILGKHIEKLDSAYKRKDHREFNILKKQVLELQRRIHSLIK